MIALLVIPLATAVVCFLLPGKRLVEWANLAGAAALAVSSVPLLAAAVSGPVAAHGFLYMDALSAYMTGLIVFLSLASSIYSIEYLDHEYSQGITDIVYIRRYYLLFHLFVASMILVTVTDNLAVMWIAIEATTVISAPLIGLGYLKRGLAIEAAWKYIILCTVGITFALLGTFITYYASTSAMGQAATLSWPALKAQADRFNPATMKLAFIFILVGYGTKAGLAPLHNWLPDAHSQAPSPISALLSGILLNTAFYGVMRFIAVVEPSTGHGFTGTLLLVFGLISFGLSALFIFVQENYKRLLAYSSIEHMGIITLGTAIGGAAGYYGALLHVLNHAVAKPLMFFCSGKIQSRYGSTNIESVRGVLTKMPLLGAVTFVGVLALSGMPPFNIFVSKFSILTAAAGREMWFTVALFLLFSIIVFFGMVSAFSSMLFNGKGADETPKPAESRRTAMDAVADAMSDGVLLVMAVIVVILGVSVPEAVEYVIANCIRVLGVK